MSLRHYLAPAWLTGLRLWRGVGGTPSGLRIVILHDTPEADLTALEGLVKMLRQTSSLAKPDDFETVRRQSGAAYLLSFDDGFASNLNAARCLAELGVSALFFVCPELMTLNGEDQRQAMAQAFFGGRPPPDDCRLLTWEEVEEIRSLGHVIGAHGLTHSRLTELSGAALEREIVDAGEAIETRLESKINWYAYSYGDIASITPEAMAIIRARYAYCRSGVRGINDENVSRYALRGEEICLASPNTYQHLILEGGIDFRYRQARLDLDVMVKTS
jgi:peptidoglycan/xylan/chitin deacetylase (PgdA/CDA1 family)